MPCSARVSERLGALVGINRHFLALKLIAHTRLRDPAAFYDGPMLINSLHVIKNFILIGDALHGLEFVNYSPEV